MLSEGNTNSTLKSYKFNMERHIHHMGKNLIEVNAFSLSKTFHLQSGLIPWRCIIAFLLYPVNPPVFQSLLAF